MIPWAIILFFEPVIRARSVPPLHNFWTSRSLTPEEQDAINQAHPQTRRVQAGDDNSSNGGLSGGAIAGIIITIILLLILSIFFIYRYNTSRPSSGNLTPSFKPFPRGIQPSFLPRYIQPAHYPTGLPPPPPAVYPINQGFYSRSAQPGQPTAGVRFGEVGVRRI